MKAYKVKFEFYSVQFKQALEIEKFFSALNVPESCYFHREERLVIDFIPSKDNDRSYVTWYGKDMPPNILEEYSKDVFNKLIAHSNCEKLLMVTEFYGLDFDLNIVKGHGFIFKNEHFSPLIISNIAVNDYTCPTCKNNRCSKSETTCWRCGNKL